MYVCKSLRLFTSSISNRHVKFTGFYSPRKALISFPFYLTAEINFLNFFLSKELTATPLLWRMPKLVHRLLLVNSSEYNICFKMYYFKIWDVLFVVYTFKNICYFWGQRQCFQAQMLVLIQDRYQRIQKTKKFFAIKATLSGTAFLWTFWILTTHFPQTLFIICSLFGALCGSSTKTFSVRQL